MYRRRRRESVAASKSSFAQYRERGKSSGPARRRFTGQKLAPPPSGVLLGRVRRGTVPKRGSLSQRQVEAQGNCSFLGYTIPIVYYIFVPLIKSVGCVNLSGRLNKQRKWDCYFCNHLTYYNIKDVRTCMLFRSCDP